jgi:hypothetical protein
MYYLGGLYVRSVGAHSSWSSIAAKCFVEPASCVPLPTILSPHSSPVSFHVDGSALDKRFRALQMQLHPDKFAKASKRFEQGGGSCNCTVGMNACSAVQYIPLTTSVFIGDSQLLVMAEGGFRTLGRVIPRKR